MIPSSGQRTQRPRIRAAWLPVASMMVLTGIVMVQQTGHALLPPRREPALWGWTVAGLVSLLFLLAGIAADRDWREAQEALGTISNSYYEPRRRAVTDGGAVLGAVSGALWWGATTWTALVTGIRHRAPGSGLLWLESSVIVGALAGGLLGAAGGRVAGELWERRHRKRRRASAASA